MRALSACRIAFRSPAGVVVAHVELTAVRDADNSFTAPLIEADVVEARDHGETTVQLRESERYEYEVFPAIESDLRLRCSLSSRRRSLGTSSQPDAGLIETRSYCGPLLLELVDGAADESKKAVATALIDVRSLKLDYRTEYRGMLRRLSNELADLVADVRSSTKSGFRSSFEQRTDAGWLQIQLELLRDVLDSDAFSASLQRILSFPHELLSTTSDTVSTDRPIHWTPAAVQQLVSRNPRRLVPASHPLQSKLGLTTVAERVSIPRKQRDVDTPENRFIKYALGEFRAFLTHAQRVFDNAQSWGAAAALAQRLGATTEDWLGRGLFLEVGDLRFVPLGSPVLQRKAGYREMLHWWLRFRTAAEISWDGGADLFRAGQRDVASLYEYWLFFELLGWFCRTCRGGNPPPIEELVDGLEAGSPNVRLKKQLALGPFTGTFAGRRRRLNARFMYNRHFEVTQERAAGGSWTRRMHPDYTLTFWPEGLDEAAAESCELLVHIHFDAKYRVESIESLFGTESADDADEEVEGNYKRQDLLKMHAYRDAIKRSQGAYVLYPGRSNLPVKFRGFHEILPGLGAFGVAPDENGAAQGLESLEIFLAEVLENLGNRTTAQERVSYHISEAYRLKEAPVDYDTILLPETDIYGTGYRALPPAEEMVMVAWYENAHQLACASSADGIAWVRLGRRRGALHVHPNFARVRRIIMRTDGDVVAPGLLNLREPGFQVFTRTQLRAELAQHPSSRGASQWMATISADDDEYIYALFQTRPDPDFAGQFWDGSVLMKQIEQFETDRRNKLVTNVGRTSPYPRILALQQVLKARSGPAG